MSVFAGYQLRYYGWYSNKKRGMRKDEVEDTPADNPDSLTAYQLKSPLTWAALIKCVYAVDPLKCPTAIKTGCTNQ